MKISASLSNVSQRTSNGEVFTPVWLVNEMLDKLPAAMFKSSSSTFLDPCFGTGTFLKEIGKRLKAEGHSSENINSRLFGFEISTRLFNETKKQMPSINLYKKDFLSEENNMKFDVIIGNPPYQGDQAGGNKTHSMWKKFIKKSVGMTDTLLLVTPSTWIGDAKVQRESFNSGHLKYAKILPSDTFKKGKVSITTSYWLWTSEEKTSDTLLDLLDGTQVQFNNESRDLPTSLINTLSISIHRKFLALPSIETTSSPIYYAHKTETETIRYPIYNTTAQGRCWSDREPLDLNHSKIIFSNVCGYSPHYDDGEMGTCWHSHSFKVDKEYSQNALNYMMSKPVRFFNMINRSGGFMNGLFCRNIPIIDFTIELSDADIYQLLGLNQEEIDYIENEIR
jgi:hypothetical protein